MHDCTNHAELLLYYEHSYIFNTERVFIGFDSLTRTTLEGSHIMNASGSGEESPEETNGPPKDMTTKPVIGTYRDLRSRVQLNFAN